MSKKFGKFLLFTAAVGTAAAAIAYRLQKSEDALKEQDEDYDDFSDDTPHKTIDRTRSYVPLTPSSTEKKEAAQEDVASEKKEDFFKPLDEVVKETSDSEKKEEPEAESVEEFFDEDSADDEEPPIKED